MKWYKNLKPWQQGLLAIPTSLGLAWVAGWLWGPDYQTFDDARCMLELLFGHDCTPRFKP